jgi:hypothetical protein
MTASRVIREASFVPSILSSTFHVQRFKMYDIQKPQTKNMKLKTLGRYVSRFTSKT